MAKQIALFVFVALFAISSAQHGGVDHSLHCHHPDDASIHLLKGESATVKGKCILIKCLDPDTDRFDELKCPEVLPAENCHVVNGNPSKPYPECCRSAKC